MVDKIKLTRYNKEYIKSVLDTLQRKGVKLVTIFQVLSPPKKVVPLSIIRQRFKA